MLVELLEFLFVGEVELHGGGGVVAAAFVVEGFGGLGSSDDPLFGVEEELDALIEVDFDLLGLFFVFVEDLYQEEWLLRRHQQTFHPLKQYLENTRLFHLPHLLQLTNRLPPDPIHLEYTLVKFHIVFIILFLHYHCHIFTMCHVRIFVYSTSAPSGPGLARSFGHDLLPDIE